MADLAIDNAAQIDTRFTDQIAAKLNTEMGVVEDGRQRR